ncbi:MAG: hypothetical protein ABR905_10625 [Terracidiphilus sp.]
MRFAWMNTDTDKPHFEQTVRGDKRERSAFSDTQDSGEDDKSEEDFRVGLGENMGFREDERTKSE